MDSPLISFDTRFAEQVFKQMAQANPELLEYTPVWRQKFVRDILLHLQFLDQAIAAESTELFRDYMSWVDVTSKQRSIGDESVSEFIAVLQDVFQKILMVTAYNEIVPYLEEARLGITQSRLVSDVSALQPSNPFFAEAQEYFAVVLEKDRQAGLQKVQEFVNRGIAVKDIYLHIFQPVQYEFGRLWQINRLSIAQEHFGTALTQSAMSQLYPQVFNTERVGFKLIAACVGSEFHEVGIRMVTDFFEMAGWDTYYLGANMPADAIVKSIEEYDADLLALSITLSTQITTLRDLIAKIRKSIDRDIKILVGGHPFNVDPKAWQVVGADGYAADAESAVNTAFMLVR